MSQPTHGGAGYGAGVATLDLPEPTPRQGGENTADTVNELINQTETHYAQIWGFPGWITSELVGIISEAMLREVQGDWDKMRTISSVYQNLAQSLGQLARAMDSDQTQLAHHWTGRAAQHYGYAMMKWDLALETECAILQWISDQLMYHAEEVQDGVEMLNSALKAVVSTLTNYVVAGAAATGLATLATGGLGGALAGGVSTGFVIARVAPTVKNAQLIIELIIHFVGLAGDIWEQASNQNVTSFLPPIDVVKGDA